MSLQSLLDEVLDRFAKDITDQVFLMIQEDRELMQKYLAAVSEHDLGSVNRAIGKAVKARFQLENLPTREESPLSTLIKSHQEY